MSLRQKCIWFFWSLFRLCPMVFPGNAGNESSPALPQHFFDCPVNVCQQNSKEHQIFNSWFSVEFTLSLLLFLNSPPTALIQPWRHQMLGSCRGLGNTFLCDPSQHISERIHVTGVWSELQMVRTNPLQCWGIQLSNSSKELMYQTWQCTSLFLWSYPS